ncbi:MAG: CMP/dCMP-type deaminase protein, partial [Patescibacteria group bacterium]|nr:CMP/dCMP-type deaminase protein [Patescibacteria group bacterium]
MKLNSHQKNDFIKKAAFISDKSTCLYKVGCVGVIEDVGQTIPSIALKDLSFRKKNGFIYLKSWNETLPGEIFC